jgi:hypothetical protein
MKHVVNGIMNNVNLLKGYLLDSNIIVGLLNNDPVIKDFVVQM